MWRWWGREDLLCCCFPDITVLPRHVVAQQLLVSREWRETLSLPLEIPCKGRDIGE